MKTKKQKQVLAHLKIWLLLGKKITHNQAQKKWGTNRLAEFIRRLRHDHQLRITTDRVGPDGYGVYYLTPDKVRRK